MGFYPPGFMPQRRRSIGRVIFSILGVFIIVASLTANVLVVATISGCGGGGKPYAERTIVRGDSARRVAVLPVSGVIMGDTAELFDQFCQGVEEDKSIKAVIVEVDTPGGSVAASDEILHRLQRLKARRGIPVVVSMAGYATSGGYYVSASADRIFARPTTITGNIGVLWPQYDVSELAGKYGVHENLIAAPRPGFKDAGSMFRPMSTEHRAYFQSLVDAAFAQFKAVVATGRTGKLKQPIDQIANGKAYTADEALKLGLIDQVGYLDDARQWLVDQGHVAENAAVVRYKATRSLLGMLAQSRRGGGGDEAAAGSVTVNGVKIELSLKAIEELRATRPMYLFRAQ